MRKLLLSRMYLYRKYGILYVMKTTNPEHTAEKLETCDSHPIGRAIRLLGNVWTLMIVYTLLSGPKRFGELLDTMGNVSPKTLSQRLKMLEESGFVDRIAFAEIPPRVEYNLTEKGLALVDVIKAIDQFAMQYLVEDDQTAPVTTSAPQSCE